MAYHISRRNMLLTAAAGMLLPETASTAPTATQPASLGLIKLSSNEYINVRTVVRVDLLPNASIDVVLASGSKLNFANADDIKLVQSTLDTLASARQCLLFKPDASTVFNLFQVTNVWNNQEGFRLWGTDGQGHSLPAGYDPIEIWKDLSLLCEESLGWAGLVRVTKDLIVNTFHCAHVSTVEGQLRFFMSNKSWPIVQSVEESNAARESLNAAVGPG